MQAQKSATHANGALATASGRIAGCIIVSSNDHRRTKVWRIVM